MKKMPPRSITNPEQCERRVVRLTLDPVGVLRLEALAQAMSGCVTTSWTTGHHTQATGAC